MNRDRFDKFTERARKVLSLAQEEATRFNHDYIGTEHLLLGLVREEEGVAATILSNLGVELIKVRRAVEHTIGRAERPITGEVGLTPRAKKVIELAVDEARRLGHHYVGTEHLLLGLLREGEGIAAGVLESLGVNLEKARAETIRVLSQSSGQQQPFISAGARLTTEGELREVRYPRERWAADRGRAEWQYLVLEMRGDALSLNGDTDERFDTGTPLHEVLHALGLEGWELVAADAAGRDASSAGARYIFKRPG